MLMNTYRTYELVLDCNASEPHVYCDITPYDSYKESIYRYSLGESVFVPVELLDSVFNSKVRTHHLDSSVEFSGKLVKASVRYRSFSTGVLSSVEFCPCYSLSVENDSHIYLMAVPEFLLLPSSFLPSLNPLKGLFFASLSSYDLYGHDSYDRFYFLLSLSSDSFSPQLDFFKRIPPMYSFLSPHFRLSEFLTSSYEDSVVLYESLTLDIVDNMSLLCSSLLEPLRKHMGVPISISSGFRTPSLNAKVGGSPNSLHMKGRAVDIYVPFKYSCRDSLDCVYSFLSGLSFSELIKYDTFVHVAL